jgi:hypothetical protein
VWRGGGSVAAGRRFSVLSVRFDVTGDFTGSIAVWAGSEIGTAEPSAFFRIYQANRGCKKICVNVLCI